MAMNKTVLPRRMRIIGVETGLYGKRVTLVLINGVVNQSKQWCEFFCTNSHIKQKLVGPTTLVNM